MKKLIVLLTLCLGFAFAQAQTVNVPVGVGSTYAEMNAAYTLTNTAGRTFKWNMPLQWPATMDFVCHLDSLSGNHTSVIVTLWGQKSPTLDDSVSIATDTWYGTTVGAVRDTTIVLSYTTKTRYVRYFSTFKGAGTGTSRITLQALKLWNAGD